jgi:predicted MFS family arabinose efflux permease
VAMFAGAIVGAVFVEHGHKTLALATALVLLAIVALLAGLWSRHQPLRFSAAA